MDDRSVIIRPPSEAASLLLPLTSGCSHNRCAFCGTYLGVPFRIREAGAVIEDINAIASSYGPSVRRVFLENGDALICPQPMLVEVLGHLRAKFPGLERVGTYASPKAALVKSEEELRALKELGLGIAYLGVETGDAELLRKIDKGATSDQIVAAGRRLKQAGITVSATVILGLAGREGSEKHARETARVLAAIDPHFAGALTLMLVPDTPLHRDWQEGRFTPLSPLGTLAELKLIIEQATFTNCFFTANHASNYLPIKVRLPRQKEHAVKLIDEILKRKDVSRLRPEFIRAL